MSVLRIVLVLALALAPAATRADTVASLLGNFTINQWSGVTVSERGLDVRHTIVFGQLPALRELHEADTDHDGVTSESERDAYAKMLAASVAERLRVAVDGTPIELRATRWTTSLPSEQGGFSLRI